MTGLETHVFDVYGDDTVIYPGHGDDTIIGRSGPDWRSGASAVGESPVSGPPRSPSKPAVHALIGCP
jgi:hypothetical protein